MRDRRACVGCGKPAPETQTDYTLISAQFGWRLTRVTHPDGSSGVEWRCPTCWREYKRARQAAQAEGVGPPSSTPTPHPHPHQPSPQPPSRSSQPRVTPDPRATPVPPSERSARSPLAAPTPSPPRRPR